MRKVTRTAWLLRNLFNPGNWLCFACFSAHIEQCRDVQYGDVWNCQAGNHYGEK